PLHQMQSSEHRFRECRGIARTELQRCEHQRACPERLPLGSDFIGLIDVRHEHEHGSTAATVRRPGKHRWARPLHAGDVQRSAACHRRSHGLNDG
ncbi:MAG: hypothetical protein ACK55I_37620, partial [bacterium]